MKYLWCQNKEIELEISSNSSPLTLVRKPKPWDSKNLKKSKKKYPYLNLYQVEFEVKYKSEIFDITVETGFLWNGTNCLGLQHLPLLLDVSMFHDKLCRNHLLIKNNRKLSTIILREMGIAVGVNKILMYIGSFFVDLYQRFRNW